MIKKTLTVAKKFHSYQRERFPIIVLALSLVPAVLSSGIIVSTNPTLLQGVYALIASLAYLLHIRVIDEHRDFGHDNVHHTTRPVQSGMISKQELQYVDITAVLILVGIAAAAGRWALIMIAVMLAYSYLASKEFFIGEKIRHYFFTYNGINLVQMLLMQVFVYTLFADPFPFTTLVCIHFLFTSIGTLVFEFVRKLKRPGDDGTGKDTYTWYLGFGNSLLIYSFLLSLNALLFFWIATLLTSHTIYALISTVGLTLIVYLTAALHWKKRSQETDQLMQLSFLLLYGIFNIAIYFLIIN